MMNKHNSIKSGVLYFSAQIRTSAALKIEIRCNESGT